MDSGSRQPQADSAGMTVGIRRRISETAHYLRLKNCTSRSCCSAAARVLNVPRFRRFPVFGFFDREYSRYLPEGSLRIIASLAANSSLAPVAGTTVVMSECNDPNITAVVDEDYGIWEPFN